MSYYRAIPLETQEQNQRLSNSHRFKNHFCLLRLKKQRPGYAGDQLLLGHVHAAVVHPGDGGGQLPPGRDLHRSAARWQIRQRCRI